MHITIAWICECISNPISTIKEIHIFKCYCIIIIKYMSEFILKFKTVQASGFQKLIECMKDILTDVNWEFDSSGIKVLCMDGSHVCLINMKLEAENFEYFYCPNNVKIGVSMNNFAKLMKNVGNNDAIEMSISTQNPNVLSITIDNMDKNISTIVN